MSSAMPTTEESLWERTTVQNLIRYRPSGTYFARLKVGGTLIRQSLETAAVLFCLVAPHLTYPIARRKSTRWS
jgi:hypothetical protein